jgi:hypothetical protein
VKPTRLSIAFSWRHALGEFILIVTGVLVAMAANSWWASRQDHTKERSYLAQLLADTRANAERVDSAFASDSAAQASTRRILALLSDTAPAPPRDSTRRGIPGGDAFSSPDFRPLLGTYTALLETGDLQLLDSPDLRFRLVAYESSLESVRETVRHTSETLERHEDSYFRALIPLLSARGGRGGPNFRRLTEIARGRQDITIPLSAAMAARSRRMRALRDLRKETRLLVDALESEGKRMDE